MTARIRPMVYLLLAAPGVGFVLSPAAITAQTATYQWVSASAPPANAVLAPDSPHSAVCRGRNSYGLWAGYATGIGCTSAYGGSPQIALTGVQYLTVVSGTAQWVSNSGKRLPGDIGNMPANTINAGINYTGYHLVLCSMGGYVGWVYSNECSIYARPRLSMALNATVLVGTVQSPP